LAENGDYADTMTQTRGPGGTKPHVAAFVDPIGFFKAVARGNLGAQAGLAILPVLGVDGLRGVGGTLTFATEQFDTLAHLHILLEEPRSGVLAMLAFMEGDTTPEAWVPHDIAAYRTGHWDVEKTFQELTTLFDSFRGDGALEAELKRRFTDEMDIDFRTEVLEAVSGRFTHTTWFEPPARIGSQAWLVGVGLKDAKDFRATFDKVTERLSPYLTEESYGRITFYETNARPPDGERDATTEAEMAAQGRPPARPCVGIVGEYLLIADRRALFERAITAQADASKSLANELDFKLIASRLRRHGREGQTCFLTFQRPEKVMRTFYDMATGEATRRRLAEMGEDNRFFATLNQSLEDNPLPPFEVIKKYLAPAGGILTNDSTGLHYTSFGLRRK
jgi:hypothetical protein